MVNSHRQCGEEGATASQPQEAEEIWLVTYNPHILLQMHHQEHPVGLYHRLVRQLVVQFAQRITGHLMSQEFQKDHQGHYPPEPLPVHPAIIQKARSVLVHQSWDRETDSRCLSQDHQTVK